MQTVRNPLNIITPAIHQFAHRVLLPGLPSQIHTSYPYGNPTKLTHPAALGTAPFGLGHAHLYQQISYDADPTSSSARAALAWSDLSLDELLPADPKKAQAERAAKARRNATGAVQQGNGAGAAQPPPEDPQPVPPSPVAAGGGLGSDGASEISISDEEPVASDGSSEF